MVRRLSFNLSLAGCLACSIDRVEAASLEAIETNGNTVIDQSEGNVAFPVIHWVNSKPVILFVRLDGNDTSSDIVFASDIDKTGDSKWYGFQIELGDGVTWSRGLRTVPLHWKISYFSFYPLGKRHYSMHAYATSVTLGFEVPIRSLQITGTKDQLDQDIAAGQAPWQVGPWAGVSWMIDRRNLLDGDGFKVRLVPLSMRPPVCFTNGGDGYIDHPKKTIGRIDEYCLDML